MTKVYLVYMSGITECNNFMKSVWAVFTNKRKAQAYCEYKKELADEKWLARFGMQTVEWTIEEERIWNDDFSSCLKKQTI